jgi:hypothetical protein
VKLSTVFAVMKAPVIAFSGFASALIAAFRDAELRNDRAALDWLNRKQARSVLLDEDRWERIALTGKTDP